MRSDAWLQELIAACEQVGIGKRELYDDYYWDELVDVFKAMVDNGEAGGKPPERMNALDYFANDAKYTNVRVER